MKNVSERLEYLSCMKDLNEMQLNELNEEVISNNEIFNGRVLYEY